MRRSSAVRSAAVNLQLNGRAVLVVAVHEGQQGIAEGAQAGEVAGGEDFLLDDGKDDLHLVQPRCVHWRVDHDRVRVSVAEPVVAAWPR